MPQSDESLQWLCVAQQHERMMLRHTARIADSLGLDPGENPSDEGTRRQALFRTFIGTDNIEMHVNGTLAATLDSSDVEVLNDAETQTAIVMNSDEGNLLLKVVLDGTGASLPAIVVDGDGWEASEDGITFSPAIRTADIIDFGFPLVDVDVSGNGNGGYDALREVYGYISILSDEEPRLYVSESLQELDAKVSSTEPVQAKLARQPQGHWRTVEPCYFRYFHVETQEDDISVACEALMRPLQYRGAFHADDELDRIWMTAAYTLRLCMLDVIAGGSKHTSIPPMSTLAVGLMANAYAFDEPEPVANTLLLCEEFGINKTSTENRLWHIFCHDMFQLYFGDRELLKTCYAGIMENMAGLMRNAAANDGILPGTCSSDPKLETPSTTLQMIYLMALQSAGRIAERMDDKAWVQSCEATAEALKEKLIETAFNDDEGLFLAQPGKPESGFSRHANSLAIISGFAEDELAEHIAERLASDAMPKASLPVMAYYDILAMHSGGRSKEAIAEIRRMWGGMLDNSATTFFAEFNGSLYAHGGDPFGNSLCHASACGPAALLPMIALGCVPVADGWDEFITGDTSVIDAVAAIPTGDGTLEFKSENGAVSLVEH